jgi:hypothetical protein
MQTSEASSRGGSETVHADHSDSTAQAQVVVSEAAALYRERAIQAGSAVEHGAPRLSGAKNFLTAAGMIGPNARHTMLIMLRQYYPESFSTFPKTSNHSILIAQKPGTCLGSY